MQYNITGDDTLTLNGRVFVDLSMGDTTTINFPNEQVKRKTGKNKNTIFALDTTGGNADLTLRVLRGSGDDQYLRNLLASQAVNFPATVLLNGTFVKRLGDGLSNVVSDVYTLSGGLIAKQPDVKENVEGDISQGETIYSIKFASAVSNIQ